MLFSILNKALMSKQTELKKGNKVAVTVALPWPSGKWPMWMLASS